MQVNLVEKKTQKMRQFKITICIFLNMLGKI